MNSFLGRLAGLVGLVLLLGAPCLCGGCGRHEAPPSDYYTGPMVKKTNRVHVAAMIR